MPYVLSRVISRGDQGMWGEGSAYECSTIYDIGANDLSKPPVHYESHTLKPHSLPHIDAPGHIIPNGETVDWYFDPSRVGSFFGKVLVVKIREPKWQAVSTSGVTHHHLIPKNELVTEITRVTGREARPEKILISIDGGHSQNQAITLDEDSAKWLCTNPKFNAYGTSWKSTDFQPGSHARPIHKILLKQAVIYECLDLAQVPEGEYFMSGFPLPLQGATESPVCPVLYSPNELREMLSAF